MRNDPLANSEQLIRRVYAYVSYRVRSREDAEDVTSETFERALRYRASYDPAKGEPAAWLIGIARRCIAGRAIECESPLDEAPDALTSVDLAAAADERLDLERALATLSPRDRELLALRYGADLKMRDVARVLELETNAAEVALHRALGRLRRKLAGEPVRKRPLGAIPLAETSFVPRNQGEGL